MPLMHNDALFIALCGLSGLFVLAASALPARIRACFPRRLTKLKKGDHHE